jgi:hypothetical protein
LIVATARWTIRRYALSTAFKTRATVGLIALALLLVAEVIDTRSLRGLLIPAFLAGFRSASGVITLLLFLSFAATPMLVESRLRDTVDPRGPKRK